MKVFKALVWFACLFIPSAITVLLKGEGIILGGIPTAIMYGVAVWLAKSLTEELSGKQKKRAKKSKSNATVETRDSTGNEYDTRDPFDERPDVKTESTEEFLKKQELDNKQEEARQRASSKVRPENFKRFVARLFNKKNVAILAVVLSVAVVVSLGMTFFNSGSSSEEAEPKYKVTFYYNRGIYFYTTRDGEERSSVKYQDNAVYKTVRVSGEYPSEPTPPTNEGYVFLGWYQNPECTIEFSFGYHKVKSNINLYAKWGKL